MNVFNVLRGLSPVLGDCVPLAPLWAVTPSDSPARAPGQRVIGREADLRPGAAGRALAEATADELVRYLFPGLRGPL